MTTSSNVEAMHQPAHYLLTNMGVCRPHSRRNIEDKTYISSNHGRPSSQVMGTASRAFVAAVAVCQVMMCASASVSASVSASGGSPPPPQQLVAVRGLLERVVGHAAASRFDLRLLDASACASGPKNATGLCGEYEEGTDGTVRGSGLQLRLHGDNVVPTGRDANHPQPPYYRVAIRTVLSLKMNPLGGCARSWWLNTAVLGLALVHGHSTLTQSMHLESAITHGMPTRSISHPALGFVRVPPSWPSVCLSQIVVGGTTGVEVAMAVNHYLKYVANCSVSWPQTGGNQIKLPADGTLPRPSKGKVHLDRSTPYSYYANVVTFSCEE
jgi:hypothetical protein